VKIQKKVSFVILLCIALQSIAPGVGIGSGIPTSRIPSVQSPVFDILVDAAAPARILDKYLQETVPLFPQVNHEKRTNNENDENASSRYVVPNIVESAGQVSGNITQAGNANWFDAVVPVTGTSGIFRRSCRPSRDSTGFVLLLMLLCLMSLSKSNLPWAIAVSARCYKPNL